MQRSLYPNSDIVYISTYWVISENGVLDDYISISALYFEKTSIKIVSWEVSQIDETEKVASNLAKELITDDLKHVLVFSDWLWVNGVSLVNEMRRVLPKDIYVTWWLAWDDPSIVKKTYVWLNSFSLKENNIVMIWFYGDAINIWSCSVSWWTKFGIKRTITKSKWNVVYEFDGEPALDLYKDYLWDKSWVFFPIPLGIFDKDERELAIRTLLKVNEEDKSIVFSADVPERSSAYFMKAWYDDLIKWAEYSVKEAYKFNSHPELAILVSCVSRKLVLRQRVEEEVEKVFSILWDSCKIIWFYSYGEIWNTIHSWTDYFLHNQTMTTILISEE